MHRTFSRRAVGDARAGLAAPADALLLALALALVGCGSLFPAPAPQAAAAGANDVSGALGDDGTLSDGDALGDAVGDDDISDDGAVTGDSAPADTLPPCDLAACPVPDEVCQVAVCVGATCGFGPAPSGTLCDDGDPCTAADRCVDGGCVGAGARNWTHVFGGDGGRLGAVLPGPLGGALAVGTAAYNATTKYDSWLLTTDADGKQLVDKDLGQPTHDDLVALARYPGGDVLAGGSADGKGRLLRLTPAHKPVFSVATSTGSSSVRAVAVTATGVALAGGMLDLNSKTGDAWAGAFNATGALLWDWKRGVPGRRVAVTRVAAAQSPATGGLPAGSAALLGYDRLLPASSGSDLYQMWLSALDAKGKPLWHTTLTKDITGSASGLVAQPDGTFVTLIDGSAGLQLQRVDAQGKVSKFATLPGGLIATASELIPGPQAGLFVVRDQTGGSGVIYGLSATGATVSQTPLIFPQGANGRVFDAAWAGDSALLLSGDLQRKIGKSSSSIYRAFIRRIDTFVQADCPAGDACRGDTHGCPPKDGCDLALCSGLTGCFSTPIAPAACGK